MSIHPPLSSRAAVGEYSLEANPDDTPKQGALGHLSADEELQQAVCSALIEAAELDASAIEVRAANARVVLSGSVQTDREQRLALRVAEQLAGAGAVAGDDLRVTQAV